MFFSFSILNISSNSLLAYDVCLKKSAVKTDGDSFICNLMLVLAVFRILFVF